jgi:hypothetical protein
MIQIYPSIFPLYLHFHHSVCCKPHEALASLGSHRTGLSGALQAGASKRKRLQAAGICWWEGSRTGFQLAKNITDVDFCGFIYCTYLIYIYIRTYIYRYLFIKGFNASKIGITNQTIDIKSRVIYLFEWAGGQ